MTTAELPADARVVRDDQFDRETAAFVSGGDAPDEPLTFEWLVASRTSRADADVAGSLEPVTLRADVVLPRPEQPIHARLYRHTPAPPQPLLLWLHGGGFVGGTLDDIDVACAGLARRTGMTVVSLDYRLAPEHPFPAALNDTYDALVWLQEHGEAFRGDGMLFAGGQSAGANLVAAACLVARDRGRPRIDGQILCYPWLDLGSDSESHRLFDDDFTRRTDVWFAAQYLAGQDVTPYAAPLTAADLTGLPPALILGAGRDGVRDDARRYARRLQESGCDVSYVEYEDAPHAFLNFPGALSVAWRAMDDIAGHLAGIARSSSSRQP